MINYLLIYYITSKSYRST